VLTGSEAVASWDFNEQCIHVRTGDHTRTIECPGEVADTYRAEIDDFLAVARGEREPAVSAAEGAASVQLAEALKRSAETGTRKVLDS
jgi:predicted dehydrogenase